MENEVGNINVTALWHKYAYESLRRIQDLDRTCRIGGVDIMEYLQLDPKRLSEVQFKHLQMLITELELLINNTSKILNDNFIKKSKKKLNMMNHLVNVTPEKILEPIEDEGERNSNLILTELYWDILKELAGIEEELIKKLSPILFGDSKTPF